MIVVRESQWRQPARGRAGGDFRGDRGGEPRSGLGVAPDMDLVDVALAISCDQKDVVAAWMDGGKVGQVSDAQALEWLEANALMWCVVVRPWVLVQPVLAASAE